MIYITLLLYISGIWVTGFSHNLWAGPQAGSWEYGLRTFHLFRNWAL